MDLLPLRILGVISVLTLVPLAVPIGVKGQSMSVKPPCQHHYDCQATHICVHNELFFDPKTAQSDEDKSGSKTTEHGHSPGDAEQKLKSEPLQNGTTGESEGGKTRKKLHTEQDNPKKAFQPEKVCILSKDPQTSLHTVGKRCERLGDCIATHTCEEYTCFYRPKEPLHIPTLVCNYTYQCPAAHKCLQGEETCIKDLHSRSNHIMGLRCLYKHNCPSLYTCAEVHGEDVKVCEFAGPLATPHIQWLHCESSYACPVLYSCVEKTCEYYPDSKAHFARETCSLGVTGEPCPIGYVCKKDEGGGSEGEHSFSCVLP